MLCMLRFVCSWIVVFWKLFLKFLCVYLLLKKFINRKYFFVKKNLVWFLEKYFSFIFDEKYFLKIIKNSEISCYLLIISYLVINILIVIYFVLNLFFFQFHPFKFDLIWFLYQLWYFFYYFLFSYHFLIWKSYLSYLVIYSFCCYLFLFEIIYEIVFF